MNDMKKKKNERAKTSVLRQLATLQTLSLDQLREKWLDLYGTEPPKYKKQFLIKTAGAPNTGTLLRWSVRASQSPPQTGC